MPEFVERNQDDNLDAAMSTGGFTPDDTADAVVEAAMIDVGQKVFKGEITDAEVSDFQLRLSRQAFELTQMEEGERAKYMIAHKVAVKVAEAMLRAQELRAAVNNNGEQMAS